MVKLWLNLHFSKENNKIWLLHHQPEIDPYPHFCRRKRRRGGPGAAGAEAAARIESEAPEHAERGCSGA